MNNLYFHVGISKTGSTFLQHNVFPKLQGIHYFPTNQFKKYKSLVQNSSDSPILLSREFDRQMEREVKKWATDFPDTKSILVLRRQDGWIASQYRRFTKNGFGLTFKEFIDIENDKGYWERDNLNFYNYIEILERYFDHKPLVLMYDELRNSPEQFIQKLANYTNSTVDINEMDLSSVHSSYNEKQLKVMLRAGKKLNITNAKPFKSSLLNTIRRYAYVYPLRYGTLYGALLLPDSMVSKSPLIPVEALEEIKEYYADDWQKCLNYAQKMTL